MANLLQSSQNQQTNAPSYYTNYLSNLANTGTQAACQAQYVGAQSLQNQAFQNAASGAGSQNTYYNNAAQNLGAGAATAQNIASSAQPYINQAAGLSATCAANPYLNAAASQGGLCAANPYLQTAALNNPAMMAQSYMNPYINAQVNQMSNIAERNILNNLAPAAGAAAAGTGQFGSQRGAQVLAQSEAAAQQCLNQNIANMLSTGYGQALCAAAKQQSLLGNLGSTAGTLQQQQQNLLGTLGSTAGTLTNQQQQNLINAGNVTGTLTQGQANTLGQLGANQTGLGTAATNARLACLNALSTLGGQQQTIAQNAQMFPLTKLGTLSSLLQGYSVPTGTTTTLCMSPLSAAAAVGSGIMGMVTPNAQGTTPLDTLQKALGLSTSPGCTVTVGSGSIPVSTWNNLTPAEQQMLLNGGTSGQTQTNVNQPTATNISPTDPTTGLPITTGNPCTCGYLTTSARGGLIQSNATGCRSTTNRGALPSSR